MGPLQQRSVNTMKLFLAASHSPNPFDLKAALVAGHAQHPVIIHFPIALFIASAFFELLAVWRKQPVFATVAYYFAVTLLALMLITLTGHLGGILSGVETP
jgi:uncharacterized membrane protein